VGRRNISKRTIDRSEDNRRFVAVFVGLMLVVAVYDNAVSWDRLAWHLWVRSFGVEHTARIVGKPVERSMPIKGGTAKSLYAPVRWCPSKGHCHEDGVELDPWFEGRDGAEPWVSHPGRADHGRRVEIRAIGPRAAATWLNSHGKAKGSRASRWMPFTLSLVAYGGLAWILYAMFGDAITRAWQRRSRRRRRR
jgi:hypothetical protein